MRNLQIIGNITADATIHDLPGGKQVINFTIAVNEKYKKQDGTQESKVTYIKCAKFQNDVQIAKYLLKGTKMFIQGKAEIDTYTDNQGVFKAGLKCIVDYMEFCSSVQSDNAEKPVELENIFAKKNQENAITKEEEHDDLPF